MLGIKELQKRAHETAVAKGWHESALLDENGVPTVTQFIAWMGLAHSEAAEADDETAHHYIVKGKPEGKIVELADVVIRLLDTSGACGYEYASCIAPEATNVHCAIAKITECARKEGVLSFRTRAAMDNAIDWCFETACELGYNADMFKAVIVEKMDFNETRPHRHGGKLA